MSGIARISGRVGMVLTVVWVAMASTIDAFAAAEPPRVAVAAFAMDDTLAVFRREATRGAEVLAERWPGTRTVVRANRRGDAGATLSAFRETLIEAAAPLDRRRDVLVVLLVSHGSDVGVGIRAGRRTETLTPADLDAALAATGVENTVVVVSACYSGVFADELAGPRRLVITAAETRRASFGCRAGQTWTYFGAAFFGEALPSAKTLREAFDRAGAAIARREKQKKYQPSVPQFRGGDAVLALLEGNGSDASPQSAPTAPPMVRADPVGCDLRREASPRVDGCEVFNGYARGRLVGSFHMKGDRTVAAGDGCPVDWPKGRLVGPGKLAVGDEVFSLRADCRASMTTNH